MDACARQRVIYLICLFCRGRALKSRVESFVSGIKIWSANKVLYCDGMCALQ